jgi:hypothetical protein
MVNATIVRAVLTLPCIPTFTTSRCPRCAIHSRNADTAISRASMIKDGIATTDKTQWEVGQGKIRKTFFHHVGTDKTSRIPFPKRPVSRIRDVLTMSLSATGSKKAPKELAISQRLARYPSNQSVADAKPKMTPEATLLPFPTLGK